MAIERRVLQRSLVGMANLGLVFALSLVPGWGVAVAQQGYTEDFRLEDCRWVPRANHPYFQLKPGFQLVLEGDDGDEFGRVEITVLRDVERVTLDVDGTPRRIRTRVVEEREFEDGELAEVSRNFFSRCRDTNAIYYFGEDVDNYEDGEIVDNEGSWKAGENGARPGLIMPGTFLLGSRYAQEIAPGIAEDRGEHVEMGLDVPTPAGNFTDCVGVLDTDALSPGSADPKVYCPGVGLVMDEDLVLVEYGFVGR